MNGVTASPLGWLRRLLRFGADRPWPALALILALSVLAAAGAQRVTFDTGATRLVDLDGLERQIYLHIAREFGSDYRSIVYVADPALWTPERLENLARLHDALRRLPFVERVDSLFSSPVMVAGESEGENRSWLARPLLPSVPDDVAEAEAARVRALADPLAQRRLVSADGNAVAVEVSIREGHSGSAVHAAIEAELAPLRPHFSRVVQVGQARLEAELTTLLLKDLTNLAPAFALAIWLVTYLFCRNAFAATLPLLVGILSLLWTAGAMGFAGRPLGVLATLLPVLVTLAGTTQILRLASGAHAELAAEGSRPRDPERHRITEFMVRDLGLPLILTIATMALGFGSTALTLGTQALRDFGLAAMVAMLSSGLLALLLIPALYATLAPARSSRRGLAITGAARFGTLPLLATDWLQRRSVRWSLAILVVFGVFAFQQRAPELTLANDPQSYFRSGQGLLEDAARLQADLAGPQVFYVTLDANAEGAFREPANLRRLADIQAFIAKQQVFDRSVSLADLVAQANQAAAGGRTEAYQVPATRRQVAQYLLPHAPQDLAPYVSHDWRRANIVVRHNLRDSSVINHHVGELRQVVASLAGPGMITHVTGENLLVNAAAGGFRDAQFAITALLLALVFLVVTVMYTSAKGGLAAVVPGLVAIVLMVGGMQLLQIPLSAATLAVTVMTIGIAIEGSVHLFSRYSALTRSMNDDAAALRETVRREAAPMLAIALTLSAGCLVLFGSGLALVAQFGALAAATLLLSALANVLLMPLVLSHVRLVGLYEILALSMQREALEASPLFQGMSDFQIRKTILISELVEVAAGELLIEQGSVARSMYVVVSGQLEVVRHEHDHTRRSALVGPGDVIGEIGFVRETRRIADVRALAPTALLRFDYARLKRDLTYFPYLMNKLNFNISGILGQRLAEVVEAQAAGASRQSDTAG